VWRFPFISTTTGGNFSAGKNSFDYIQADLKEVRRVVLEASSWTFQDVEKFNQDEKILKKKFFRNPPFCF